MVFWATLKSLSYKVSGELTLITVMVCSSKGFTVRREKEVEQGSKGVTLVTFHRELYLRFDYDFNSGRRAHYVANTFCVYHSLSFERETFWQLL